MNSINIGVENMDFIFKLILGLLIGGLLGYKEIEKLLDSLKK